MAAPDSTALPTPIAQKECLKCREIKPIADFNKRAKSLDGFHTWCRTCVSEYKKRLWHGASAEQIESRKAQRKRWDTDHQERKKEYNAAYYAANKAKLSANSKAHYRNNIEKAREWHREYYDANKERILDWHRGYRRDNRDHANKRSARYTKMRKAKDVVFDLRVRVVANISGRIRAMGYTKRSRTHEILGCDFEFFKLHIERQFLRGMTWENRGAWHLDHIIPLATAKTEADVIRLNHFTNLRPMWAEDNLSKGAKVLTLL